MLADIMKESDSYYQPKKDLYNQQLSQTDPQQQAEVQGLQQQQQDTFSQIRDQAQRRGLFFSGIPIAEQARYTGSQFLPAVANLQSKYAQQRSGLQGALADLGSQQYSDAMGVQQKQKDQEFQAEQGRLAREASAAGSGQFNFGGSGTNVIPPTVNTGTVAGAHTPQQEALWTRMTMKPTGGLYTDDQLKSDFQQTYISAQYGNAQDQQKLQMYYSMRPDIFNAEAAKGIPMPKPAAAPVPSRVSQTQYTPIVGAGFRSL